MREKITIKRKLVEEDVRAVGSALVIGVTGALSRDSYHAMYYVVGAYIASQAVASLINLAHNYCACRNDISIDNLGVPQR
jgi:hypothetical protein